MLVLRRWFQIPFIMTIRAQSKFLSDTMVANNWILGTINIDKNASLLYSKCPTKAVLCVMFTGVNNACNQKTERCFSECHFFFRFDDFISSINFCKWYSYLRKKLIIKRQVYIINNYKDFNIISAKLCLFLADLRAARVVIINWQYKPNVSLFCTNGQKHSRVIRRLLNT